MPQGEKGTLTNQYRCRLKTVARSPFRPLKRVIQKQLQDPLAELILSGKVKDGDFRGGDAE